MKKTDERERKIEDSVPKIEEVKDELEPIDQQKIQLAVTKTVKDNEFLTFEHEEEQKPQKKINYS